MKCNCIEETNKKIRETTGDPEASLNTMFSLKNQKMERVIGIGFTYRKKNKRTGEFNKKKEDSIIALKKCPFCGESISD